MCVFACPSLTVGQVCSFLVRPSDNTPGDYSLFFRTNENIQRFKISPTPNNQYMMGGRYYNRYVPCLITTSRGGAGLVTTVGCAFWTHSLSLSLVASVDDIIDHYKKEQIVEGYNLKEPVSVQVGARRCRH